MIPEPELETELLTVTENESGEAINDIIAENDGFVAPNYDYVTTLTPIKTVDDKNGKILLMQEYVHFMTLIRFGDPSTARIWFNGMENPVGSGRYNITALFENHCHRLTMRMKTSFTKLIFICLFIQYNLHFVNKIS